MPEYIERESAKRAIRDLPVELDAVAVQRAIEVVDRVSSADVEPVRHGAWEYDPNAMDYNLGGWVCNLCGVRNNNIGSMPDIPPLRFSGSRYCPNCGARMHKEEQV